MSIQDGAEQPAAKLQSITLGSLGAPKATPSTSMSSSSVAAVPVVGLTGDDTVDMDDTSSTHDSGLTRTSAPESIVIDTQYDCKLVGSTPEGGGGWLEGLLTDPASPVPVPSPPSLSFLGAHVGTRTAASSSGVSSIVVSPRGVAEAEMPSALVKLQSVNGSKFEVIHALMDNFGFAVESNIAKTEQIAVSQLLTTTSLGRVEEMMKKLLNRAVADDAAETPVDPASNPAEDYGKSSSEGRSVPSPY